MRGGARQAPGARDAEQGCGQGSSRAGPADAEADLRVGSTHGSCLGSTRDGCAAGRRETEDRKGAAKRTGRVSRQRGRVRWGPWLSGTAGALHGRWPRRACANRRLPALHRGGGRWSRTRARRGARRTAGRARVRQGCGGPSEWTAGGPGPRPLAAAYFPAKSCWVPAHESFPGGGRSRRSSVRPSAAGRGDARPRVAS